MTSRYERTAARVISEGEADAVQEAMREFSDLQTARSGYHAPWEDIASLIVPMYRGTFTLGRQTEGAKKTDAQVDATGMLALARFAAICDSLLTPRNMKWHELTASDPNLMKNRRVRLWFEQVNNILFQLRYDPSANYASQNNAVFKSLGAFGNGSLFIDKLYSMTGERGYRYASIPLGETFFKENHQKLIDGCVRFFRLTARQAEQKWPGQLPPQLWPALEKNTSELFDFIHRICPRTDNYDPLAPDARSMLYRSQYVCLSAKCMMPNADTGALEGGYNTFPYAPSMYERGPGEVYGQGPAGQVLPALKTLNAEKTVFLKQGHRAADPVLLTHDDGVIPTLKPGSVNPGGMSAEGRPLIGILPSGDIQINEKMMLEERGLINDAFLVSLFQILTESPQMTATEVIERINEKGILLAPTVGAQMSGYLGPKIHREIDLASNMNLLPPMPEELKEAGGAYEVVYTSPLAKAMRAGEASGFMRLISELKEVFAVTQDPALFDPINFTRAVPALADIHNVPVDWMEDDETIAKKKMARAKQQQIEQRIQAAPAAAAMMKAQQAQQQGA